MNIRGVGYMSMVLEQRGVEVNAIEVKRMEVWFADLGNRNGSEQRGQRPVLIISNNRGNKHSPVVVIAPISSQIQKAKLPTHVVIKAAAKSMLCDSVVMFEQITTLDKSQLIYKMFELPTLYSTEVRRGITMSLGL